MEKRKQTVAEKIANTPIEQIIQAGSKNPDYLRKTLTQLRAGYSRRVGSFRRQGVFSHAQEIYERQKPPKKTKIKDMGHNQLILEISKLQHFFRGETSTLEGIRRVNREQDERLFGTDSRGRPLDTMTDAQRREFWDLYDEFLNQNPTAFPASESVQQHLADLFVANDKEVGYNMLAMFERARRRLGLS